MKSTTNPYAEYWRDRRDEDKRRHEQMFARRIIPTRDTEDDVNRARHLDLPVMTEAEIWAEQVVLKQELARRIFYRARDNESVWFGTDCMSAEGWAQQRLHKLAAELQARGRRGRAA